MKNTLPVVLVVLALTLSLSAQSSECLIVRSAEGHRFRNAMIAGALTGGIGLAAGAAFSGAKYEYADSYNLTATKPKYSGKELEKMQSAGVHVIVVNKKTASAAKWTLPVTLASPPVSRLRKRFRLLLRHKPPQRPLLPLFPLLPLKRFSLLVVTPVPVPVPVKASAPLCTASIIDANGNQTCTQYARQ